MYVIFQHSLKLTVEIDIFTTLIICQMNLEQTEKTCHIQ